LSVEHQLLARDARERFITAYTFLCVSKNTAYDDVSIHAAMEVMGELPIDAVEWGARSLAQEGTHFMPSLGEWFEVADTKAAHAFASATEALQLTAGIHLEDEELASLTTARDAFVQLYETTVGKALPDDHVWKTPHDHLQSYHCLSCRDTGWRHHTCVEEDECHPCGQRGYRLYDHEYVDQCVCFFTNPVLVGTRAHAQRSTRLRKNIRKEGR
jgi:hypothetical protein